MKRTLAAFAALAASAAGLAAWTPTADAAPIRNGVCDAGELCYYYNSDRAGSLSDHSNSLGNLGDDQATCYVFKSAGNGKGLCVKNNAASVYNHTTVPVTVYENSNFGGRTVVVKPGQWLNLGVLKNNNASHKIGTAAAKTEMSTALYKNAGATLECDFDSYKTTPGRHEGIDFSLRNGAAIYALTEGKITNIDRGAGGTLSTLAIYHAKTNKTVIYLHANIGGNLAEGQTVARGQQIGSEGTHGASNSHTHVEVRNGQQTHAAKSVRDYTLDNPNPHAFWVSQGYVVS